MATAPAPPPTLPTPPTLLPSDPTSLQKYLHHQHLISLRRIFERQSITHAIQMEEEVKLRRQRANTTATTSSRGRQQQRRRKGADNREASPTASNDTTLDTDDVGDEESDGQRKGPAEGAATTASKAVGNLGPEGGDAAIDSAHAYDLVFDLAPGSASDTYYHGPHPPPPCKVIKTVLSATQQTPFFDPDQLSTKQLLSAANALWEEEGKKVEKEVRLVRDGEGGEAEQEEREEDWEANVVAGFSWCCDERIARGRAILPLTERPFSNSQPLHPAPGSTATAGGVGVGGGGQMGGGGGQQQQQQQSFSPHEAYGGGPWGKQPGMY